MLIASITKKDNQDEYERTMLFVVEVFGTGPMTDLVNALLILLH